MSRDGVPEDVYAVRTARGVKLIRSPANLPPTADGFYSTDSFTDELIGYLEEREETPDLKAKPFFAYHAYTAPHWPLQAPRAVREKYKGMYDDGPRALRDKRLKRLREMGLVGEHEDHPMENYLSLKEWDDMSPDERQKSARAMETVSVHVFALSLSIKVPTLTASMRRW